MKRGCSESSFAGGQFAETVGISACHQWSRPCFIATSILLRTVQVQVLDTPEQRGRAQTLLATHHCLGAVQAVGEQLIETS